MSEELKACPFCGKDSARIDISDQVVPDCGCLSGDPYDYDFPDYHVWNTRPIEDAQAAEIERLTAVLNGDPSQTATKEDREAWRVSAVRYSHKLEAEIEKLTNDKLQLRSHMEAAINAHDPYAYREDVVAMLAILRKGLKIVP